MLAGNRLSNFSVGYLNRDNAVTDLNGFCVLDLQGSIDLESAVDVYHDAGLLIGMKAGRVDLQFVSSDWNNRERILPLVVAGCGLFGSVGDVVQSDCCTSHQGSTRIIDQSGDSSCYVGPCTVEQK